MGPVQATAQPPTTDAIPVTPVIRTGTAPASPEVSMVDVTVAAFGVTGALMAAAVVAGLLAGIGYTWYRAKHAVTTIEARGDNHNFLRY